MAELKISGRQFGQPSAPSLEGAKAPAAALNNVLQTGFKSYGDYVEKQRNAALELESSFNALAGQKEMDLNLLNAKQNPNLSPESIAEFNATQSQIMDSILQNTSKENQKYVKLKLQSIANRNELDMREHAFSVSKKKTKDTAAVLLYEDSKQLEQDAINGRDAEVQDSFAKIDQTRRALVESGDMSELEYRKGKDDLTQSVINGRLENGLNLAFGSGGEESAAKYINEFYHGAQKGLTTEQKSEGLKHLITVANREKAALSRASYLGYNNVVEKLNSANPPKDETEVNTLINKSAEEGLPLNEWQASKVIQKFRKTNNKELKREQRNIEIAKNISSANVNALIAESGEAIDNYFMDTRKALVDRQMQQMESAGTDAQRIMAEMKPWMISASIVAEIPVPVKQWQDELHSQLHSTNVEDILGATKGYEYASTKNKASIDGLNAKDKAFMDSILDDMKYTNKTPEESIELYKKEILNVDPTVAKNRNDAYTDIVKNNPNLPNKIVKKAFGEKIGNILKEPSAQLYAVAQQQFEKEYKITGDVDRAAKNAVSYLKDNGGVSAFGPKDSPVWNPPENLPFYDYGNIVRNQATKYLKEAVINNERNPELRKNKIEWSDKMPKFPDELSEEDLYKGEYDKGEWWLKIDDQDRRVYFISPNYNQANAFPVTQYQVMYEKDGYLHNLTTINPVIGANGQPQPRLSNSLMSFYGPSEITPNLVKSMQSEVANNALTKGATERYNKEHALDRSFTNWIFKDRTAEQEKEKKIIEKEKLSIKEQIEKQKLARQKDQTKEFIKGQGETP